MTAREGRTARTLSPVQLRAIALRVQGLDITEIASEVGRDRTTVSRWFTMDPLVIEELDRRVEDQYETELAQHANLRKKAMGVIEGALDGGDVRAALTILRLSPKQSGRPPGENDISSSTDPYASAPGHLGHEDLDSLLRELEVTSPWQVLVHRVDALLRSPDPVSDVEGILDRLLFLDDVASTAVRALEEANGEGLAGYSSVTGQQQEVFLDDARRAIDEAWTIVGGRGDDDDEPTWPGEESADRAIRLIGEALVALHASLEGATPETLTIGAGADGARLAARLTAARGAARLVIDSDERPTVRSLADAVTMLTAGFRDLVGALGEGATITFDPAWAEAPDGEGGGGADA